MKNSLYSRKNRLVCLLSRRAFSLLDVLMAVAILSSVAAMGYLAISSLTGPVKAGKLQSDVTTINNAVRTYLIHGGRISASADGPQVISQLKRTASEATSKRLAGLRGTMLDGRLRGELITTDGPERAVWNPATQRFELKTSGTGFQSFDLGADPAAAAVEEDRKGTHDFAERDQWVWDSGAATVTTRALREMATTAMPVMEPDPPAFITRLATPDISLAGDLYDASAFDPFLSVSLVDRNSEGTSQIFYSLDNGPWIEYTGSPVQIPQRLTTTLRTYTAATNPEEFEDSDIRTERYETIYFTGLSSGTFHSPLGDSGMKTNLGPGQRDATFQWGNPTITGARRNELQFTGSEFKDVAPDQEFVVGRLDYFNGTTFSGTNATSVEIAIDLDLTTPGVKESLNFTFKLLSTPNQGKSADADADYVWIPDVSTTFRTVIKGKTFALMLRFGEHGPDGFTTIDTFHAHEGKTLHGTIYGRLTAVDENL